MKYRKLLEALKNLTDYQLDTYDVAIVGTGSKEVYPLYECAYTYPVYNYITEGVLETYEEDYPILVIKD